MNIYNKDQFNKEFRQEGPLSKAFISTKTYSKSDLDKKMDEITKFFEIQSADVTEMEGKKEGEYYIRVTIPRSAFEKVDLPEPVFVDRMISSMERLPNELQEKSFLDLSEEDFHEMDRDFEGMIAGLGADEKSKVIDDAIILRFETKIAKLQKTRESLIQSFTKIKDELFLEDPDIQMIVTSFGNSVSPDISFKIENARNALDENISILRAPLLSLDKQMQKALGTKNDLETTEKLKDIKSKDLFNLLKTYLNEQHEAIIDEPFQKLAFLLTRARVIGGLTVDTENSLVETFIKLFAKKMLYTNPDVFIHFLNTPLKDNQEDDFTLKRQIIFDFQSHIEEKISSDNPRESRLNEWKILIDLYRKKDLIINNELSRLFSQALVILKSVDEISDMEKEIEFVRMMPNNVKDRRLEELVMRLTSLKSPAIKSAEELVLEVRNPDTQESLRRDIVGSIKKTYLADLVILDQVLRNVHVSKDPEIDGAYVKAHTTIDRLLRSLQDKCTRALQSSIDGNRNSSHELRVSLEKGKSDTLKEVVNIIKELFSILKAKFDPSDFLAKCGAFFKEIMVSAPFLTRVLISHIGLDEKEIHEIFRSIIKSGPNDISSVLQRIPGLLKSIPKLLDERYRQDLVNQAVQLVKDCINSTSSLTLDREDIRKPLLKFIREISQEELKASLLLTYIRQIRGILNFSPAQRHSLIMEIPEAAINREEEGELTYREMAEALFEHLPVQAQNPEAAEEVEEAEE